MCIGYSQEVSACKTLVTYMCMALRGHHLQIVGETVSPRLIIQVAKGDSLLQVNVHVLFKLHLSGNVAYS